MKEADRMGSIATLNRPPIRRIALASVWPPLPGEVYLTMSPSQWDATLAAAYDADCILVEVDDDERPVAAYQRNAPCRCAGQACNH